MICVVTASLVRYPRITSTSFITGTGFMKCMPMTWSGLLVTEAIFVIEIEEVFEARIVFGLVLSSSSLKIFNFKSIFSVAASMTNSASRTPSFINVVVERFSNAFALIASVITPFSTCRPRFFSIVATAFFNASSEISIRHTEYPCCART